MSVWDKVLIVLILILTLPLYYFSARMLKTQQAWESAVQFDETQMARFESGDRNLEQKASEVRRLRSQLAVARVDQGRSWYNVVRQQVNAQTGQVSVAVAEPQPHGIADNAVVYLFESSPREEGGMYLGEYAVEGVDGANVALRPTLVPSARQRERLAQSQAPWEMLEVMPGDRPELFTDPKTGQVDAANEARVRALLPASVAEQYLKQGKEAAANDPPDQVLDGVYQRPLADFTAAFTELDRQLTLLRDSIAATQADTESIERSTADAQKHIAMHEQEKAELQQELERTQGEAELATRHRQALETRLADLDTAIAQALARNQELAAQWTTMQVEAAEAIDARVPPLAN